jgi:hypothetical protein
MNTEDIPSISDQPQRVQEVTMDCYNQGEELGAFEVYFADAMHFPFAATWRDPDELDSVGERRGILLGVKRLARGGKQRRLLAEKVWAEDEDSANAIVLDDYRYWIEELNGLTRGFG